jgi:hypothetical protein
MRHPRLAAMVAALLVLAPAAALAEGQGPGEQRTSDGYTVALSTDAPAQTGQNRITVSIRDPQGAPVTGASVELRLLGRAAEEQGHSHGASDAPEGGHAEDQGHSSAEGGAMPGMDMPEDDHTEDSSAMPGMDMPEDSHAEGGHAEESIASVPMEPSGQAYQATLALDEAGTWAVAVAFRDGAGQERAVELSLEVAQQRPRDLVLGGFLAVNLLAIGGAAALRTISPPKPRGNGRRTPAQEKPA